MITAGPTSPSRHSSPSKPSRALTLSQHHGPHSSDSLGSFGPAVPGVKGWGGGSDSGSQPWLHSGITWEILSQGCSPERAHAPVVSKNLPSNMAPAGTLFAGLIFTTTKTLDREMQAKYEIVVEARDAQGLRGESGTATVLVTLQDINDNFPIFTQGELFPQGP